MLDVSSENPPKKARRPIVLRSISHTLAYADVFDYPLTAAEVFRYLNAPESSFQEVTEALSNQDLFTQVGEYFTLRGREEIVETRRRRAKIAARLWKKATRYARYMSRIPFVRMVAVTGSLAMNNADENKDIDYMIVTAPGHLWTCRAFSLLIARFARLEGVRLCPNYLVTTNALELTEQSLYVAHELVQMIPLFGREVYEELLRLNHWIQDYLPNSFMVPADVSSMEKPSGFQKLLEILFRLAPAGWIEKWEMTRKIERLTREQSSSSESYFSADVCKGHIDRHGENVVTALAVRLQKASTKATDPHGVLREVATTEVK